LDRILTRILNLFFILSKNYSILPLNETALLVSFENVIDSAVNEKVIALQSAFVSDFFPGFIEVLPAYNSLAVFYDIIAIKKYQPAEKSAFEFVKTYAEKLIEKLDNTSIQKNYAVIKVPVYYNGVDLSGVAHQHGISITELIRIHAEKMYRVYMIGFQPGFTYMGKLDERIATPRKNTPRKVVPAGSVGIAGFQTGIYPFSSPGGWQLIGQTPLKIFDKEKLNPCLFKAGDNINFYSISKEEFDSTNEY
jgi:inhibitor of KinA